MSKCQHAFLTSTSISVLNSRLEGVEGYVAPTSNWHLSLSLDQLDKILHKLYNCYSASSFYSHTRNYNINLFFSF